MQNDPTRPSPLPKGWVRAFFDEVDLEASYAALAGCQHFHAETMRGVIRSLEVRVEEAEKHFARAFDLSGLEPRTIPNLVRRITLTGFWLENKLVAGWIQGLENTRPLEFPDLPQEVVDEYPEVRFVNQVRLSVDGEIRLHLGSWEESAAIFRDLIQRCEGEPEDVLAVPYIGLAASLYNLGDRDAAMRNLENAGLCMQVGGTTLNRARVAANLHALYQCLGEDSAARDWRAFLDHLPCPSRTKSAFLKRSEILLDRWTERPVMLLL